MSMVAQYVHKAIEAATPWLVYERQGMTLPGIYFNAKENNTNLKDEYTAKESIRRIQDREEPPYKKKRKSLWPS